MQAFLCERDPRFPAMHSVHVNAPWNGKRDDAFRSSGILTPAKGIHYGTSDERRAYVRGGMRVRAILQEVEDALIESATTISWSRRNTALFTG
jgi:hypothetical protein